MKINDLLNHPKFKNIDPAKAELIRLAAVRSKDKKGKELAPVMMTLITGARKQGIQFSAEEMDLIFTLMKDGRSDKEKEQIDHTIRIVKSVLAKYNQT